MSSSDYKDERWCESRFGLQPVYDVVEALKWIEQSDINKYNISSVSTAKLGTVVVGALAGKKAKTSVEDFLPFDTRRIKKNSGVTDESIAVLQRLMKTRKMDGRVIGMLADELKTAALRNDSE